MDDTSAARARVIGILKVVHKEWNQAASQQQSAKQKLNITVRLFTVWMCAILHWLKSGLTRFSGFDKTLLTRRTQTQGTWATRISRLCTWRALWPESDKTCRWSAPESESAAFRSSQTLAWESPKGGRTLKKQCGIMKRERRLGFKKVTLCKISLTIDKHTPNLIVSKLQGLEDKSWNTMQC